MFTGGFCFVAYSPIKVCTLSVTLFCLFQPTKSKNYIDTVKKLCSCSFLNHYLPFSLMLEIYVQAIFFRLGIDTSTSSGQSNVKVAKVINKNSALPTETTDNRIRFIYNVSIPSSIMLICLTPRKCFGNCKSPDKPNLLADSITFPKIALI